MIAKTLSVRQRHLGSAAAAAAAPLRCHPVIAFFCTQLCGKQDGRGTYDIRPSIKTL